MKGFGWKKLRVNVEGSEGENWRPKLSVTEESKNI